MYIIRQNDDFPPIEYAGEDGLLAIGGDLSLKRLTTAYQRGIFPWYDASQPTLWWSPDPRMVLFPEKLKVSKSMKQVLKKGNFRVTYNEAFAEVLQNCASIDRKGQSGTWLVREMIDAYIGLHQLGMAISIEVWEENELVGGLYGIYLREKQVFCGESMFAKKSNASKFGFIQMVKNLQAEGVKLIDCQVYTKHLASLGAEEISRGKFLKYLE
ncbi:leucyl/phenylalanyl-tRNA--protein transferase [Autumnicola psychrophila]|uniref:Leucyl/phenylalanyl-tRNA--protein transferase n=1 Tax=Autumnicola psychrophila TaxID=3075592 RepID=A0ABU3DY73_9FLAO|nr:leucyl/phenylalanyl-tRNA--protein transferase [Zunongwangia sp. F225]MDT0688002.1 leucyl/phenylalanyl-tRNA--protein transferase [Zunongwangia sp. F225]